VSLDLVDIKRLKITPETAAWLEAQWRRNPSRSKQEILRDALHDLAIVEIHAARLLTALSPAEGQTGTPGGSAAVKNIFQGRPGTRK
jgi:hypothetical protein